jgi:SOS-response transcriptional repressor LexA
MRDIGKKIRERRERLGWGALKLATLAGISQSFLNRIENGKKIASWETYTKIAGALGVPIDAFFSNQSNVQDAPLGWRRIPVLDYVQAGRWSVVDGFPKDQDAQEFVLTDLEHPPSTFAMRIRGNSMEPEFMAGDVVVIAPTVQPRPGDYVVATDETGEATFKQYRNAGVNERGDRVFELHPLNPTYAPMRSDRQQLAIVGTMVEHRRYRRRG